MQTTTSQHSSQRWRLVLALLSGAVCFGYLVSLLPIEPIFNSEGFIERSKQPLFSLAFFTGIRPFTTDFVYKLAGSDPHTAVVFQLAISTFSWAFLGFAVSGSVRSRVFAALAIVVIALASLWWNVAGWNWVMRSESLSFSLLAAWLGCLLLLYQKPGWLRLIPLAVVTVFFSFTRDNLPPFLVGITSSIVLFAFVCKRRESGAFRRVFSAYLGVVLGVAVCQGISAHLGKRHVFPLLNVLFQRVLTDEQRLEWFESHGMPCDDSIMAFRGLWASSHDFVLYEHPKYAAFLDWVERDGKLVYGKYLLTHPGYTLTLKRTVSGTWYGTDSYESTNSPPRSIPLTVAGWVYCAGKWNLYALGVLALVGLVLFFKHKLNTMFVLPALLHFWLYTNLLFVFHADAMEVERHSLMIPIAVHVVMLFTVFLLVDVAWQRWSRRLHRRDVRSLETLGDSSGSADLA